MAKVERNLLFIKSTGTLIGEIPQDTDSSQLNLDKFLIKTVEIDDEAGDYWYGDYSTGEVRSRSDKPVLTESYVKYNTNVTVLKEYPIHKQLNIIIDMLDKNSAVKTDEFIAMKEFIDAARNQHAEQVQAYASNPDAYTWINEDQEQAILAQKQKL
jgi:uncharacterized protein YlxP (DUF503 family)